MLYIAHVSCSRDARFHAYGKVGNLTQYNYSPYPFADQSETLPSVVVQRTLMSLMSEPDCMQIEISQNV